MARRGCLSAFLAFLGTIVLTTNAIGQVRVRLAEAFPGDPFGVGRIAVEVPEGLLPEPLGEAGLGLTEANGRVLYPVVEAMPGAGMVRDVLSQAKRPALRILGQFIEPPGRTTIYFLFRGRDPLKLTLRSKQEDAFVLQPMPAPPAALGRLLGAWWLQYSATRTGMLSKPDYPPMIENYLQSMLAHRLGLQLPAAPRQRPWEEQFGEELHLAGATEALRIAYQRDRFLAVPPPETATGPLPEPIVVGQLDLPDAAADVKVEPMAMHVPAECFYLRFGSFSNFLWFQDTLALWNGDLQNLLASRGLDQGNSRRIETRLAVQTTFLSRLFGAQVINDVAIIGTDLFLADGGAYGLLFQARSSRLLANDFAQKRKERLQNVPGATEEKLKIEGQDVSFLSTPDGSIRSYYAASGDYHFVTTSRVLAQRFLQACAGKDSLGATKEFRHARACMSLSDKDSVFAYLSSRFFENYVSPTYQVESIRRLRAQADIEMVELALLAAAAEKSQAQSIEALVNEGYLPPRFGARGDGSRTVVEQGQVRDSLRGERGSFLPVPDVGVQAVTPREADSYRRFTEIYRQRWQRLDPVLARIQREDLEKKRERVTIDAKMMPLSRQQYERLARNVGQPDTKRVAAIAGDAVAFEVITTTNRIFSGIQALGLPNDLFQGPLLPFGRLRDLIVGYIGTTGDLGFLGFLRGWISNMPDLGGFARVQVGLARRQWNEFTVYSFQQELLDSVVSRLHYENTQRPGQAWLRVADLTDTRLHTFANGWGYYRSRQTAEGNLRLMHQMIEQFHVPGDKARTGAELLLDAKLVCPLGGQFVYRQPQGGAAYWTSTALEGAPPANLLRPQLPPGFEAPPLNWFRGLDLEALLEPNAVSVHAVVLMQLPEKKATAAAR